MHGVSYAALMLIVDGLPDTSGNKKQQNSDDRSHLSTDPNVALEQARVRMQQANANSR